MGYATSIKCKCQEKPLWLDVGIGYHWTYQEVMKKIRQGEYGPEMKEIIQHSPLAVVDATLEPFLCDKCGYVESTMPLDIFEPKDIEEAKKTVINRWSAGDPPINKTVEELGEYPYWYPHADKKGFKIVKKYNHACPKCGNIMKKTSIKKLYKTQCPTCGETYSKVPGIFDMHWD